MSVTSITTCVVLLLDDGSGFTKIYVIRPKRFGNTVVTLAAVPGTRPGSAFFAVEGELPCDYVLAMSARKTLIRGRRPGGGGQAKVLSPAELTRAEKCLAGTRTVR